MLNMSEVNNEMQSKDNRSGKVSFVSLGSLDKKCVHFRGSKRSIELRGDRAKAINVKQENSQFSKRHSPTKKCGIYLEYFSFFTVYVNTRYTSQALIKWVSVKLAL